MADPAPLPTTPGLLTRRPRDRPRGARTRVLRHESALGVHHFAFLRSWFLGLDLRHAWQRYLAFSALSDDLRHIEHRRAALLRQVLDAGHQLNLGLPPGQQITAALVQLAQPHSGASSAPLPSLDEFIESQGLDREFYSEAELLAEYRDFFHLDGPPEDAAPDSGAGHGQAQVRALNQVEALLARHPEAGDRLDLWLSPALSALLRQAGIGTLGALADTVRVHGHRWHARAPGLGQRRAGALVAWLAPLAEGFGQAIPDQARRPAQQLRAAQRAQTLSSGAPEAAPRFALVPLERLAVPPHLAGGTASTASPAARSSASGHSDLQALRAWLATHAQSPATHRAYAKEVERFYLWCLHRCGRPLSGITPADAQGYRDFLAAPPADWVNPRPTPRDDPAWRPLRGPLSGSSQRFAESVVRALFDGLCAGGHLPGNPWRGRMPATASRAAPASPATPAVALPRAFGTEEWAFVRGQLDRLEQGESPEARGQAEARRLRLLLCLLSATGLRLSEIAAATLDDLRLSPQDTSPDAAGEPRGAGVLRVRGRQGTPRELPLDAELLSLIAQHHADASAIAALPSPAPIVCTLGERPRRWVVSADGAVALSPRAAPAVAALSAAGIYRTLKRFFRRIASQASGVDGLSRERLQAASTHWLRHTFGLQAAESGAPAQWLREALGHAGLGATGVYVDASRGRTAAPDGGRPD